MWNKKERQEIQCDCLKPYLLQIERSILSVRFIAPFTADLSVTNRVASLLSSTDWGTQNEPLCSLEHTKLEISFNNLYQQITDIPENLLSTNLSGIRSDFKEWNNQSKAMV
jgi:hypothetical protein